MKSLSLESIFTRLLLTFANEIVLLTAHFPYADFTSWPEYQEQRRKNIKNWSHFQDAERTKNGSFC